MPKKKAFNNRKVLKLFSEYTQGKKKSARLRNKILKCALPLVDAALVRKLHKSQRQNRGDIRQECIVKLLLVIPKFDPERGVPFAFFWAIICNTIITQSQRMFSTNVSLSPDDSSESASEIEIIGLDIHTPETQHVLNRVTTALDEAFSQNGFKVPDSKGHRIVFERIKKYIRNGDFFFNRAEVFRKLGRLGLSRSEIDRYADYALVKVRKYLLDAREEIDAISGKKVEGVFPPIPLVGASRRARGKSHSHSS